jgi:hypothetical protein
MTTTLEQPARSFAIGAGAADPESFDWSGYYNAKAEGFKSTAQTWRNIAHTCQLAGDDAGVTMAHKNALENEAFAKDAEQQAKLHQSR